MNPRVTYGWYTGIRITVHVPVPTVKTGFRQWHIVCTRSQPQTNDYGVVRSTDRHGQSFSTDPVINQLVGRSSLTDLEINWFHSRSCTTDLVIDRFLGQSSLIELIINWFLSQLSLTNLIINRLLGQLSLLDLMINWLDSQSSSIWPWLNDCASWLACCSRPVNWVYRRDVAGQLPRLTSAC